MYSRNNNEYCLLCAVAERGVQIQGKRLSADDHAGILRDHMQSRGRLIFLVVGGPLETGNFVIPRGFPFGAGDRWRPISTDLIGWSWAGHVRPI
jgi:hypothetical protein